MIEVRKLVKRFGLKTVLRGVDFHVQPGEFVALLGPNGAGKTTFLRILASLARPSLGSVSVAGFALPAQSAAVRRRLGVVSHQSLLYDDLTAAENLQFYGRMYNIPKLNERISAVLEMIGLSARRNDPVRTFSRGMQQRLSVARALVHDPAILFLDEPFTGLDPAASSVLEATLAGLRRQGRTLVVTTHDLARGLALSDRWMILARGRVAGSGRSAEVDPARFESGYLDAVAARG
jgi:heme exporter protein A